MTQFEVFEERHPEKIERAIQEWLSDGEKIIENHTSFARPDLYTPDKINIVIVIQYHMKG